MKLGTLNDYTMLNRMASAELLNLYFLFFIGRFRPKNYHNMTVVNNLKISRMSFYSA